MQVTRFSSLAHILRPTMQCEKSFPLSSRDDVVREIEEEESRDIMPDLPLHSLFLLFAVGLWRRNGTHSFVFSPP